MDFPSGTSGKESTCNAGDTRDLGLISRLGRCPGEGNGNPLQYSCLENSMDGGAWRATVHGAAKSQTRLRTYTPYYSVPSTVFLQPPSVYHFILTIALWGFIILHNHPHHYTLILAIRIIGLQMREKLRNFLQSLSDDQQSCSLNAVSLRVQLLHYCLPLPLYHWRDKGGRGIVDRLKWNKCICVGQRHHASYLEPGGGGWLGVCIYVLAAGK